jgi:hypothetical protein
MSKEKKNLTPNEEITNLEEKGDYGNTDNRIPAEVEEEFFPEPKKHPEQEYLD